MSKTLEDLARNYAERFAGHFEFAVKWSEVEQIYLAGMLAMREMAAEVATKEANSFEADKSGDYRDGHYLAARGIARDIRALGVESKDE